jgi:hypothetical protein
MGKRVADELRSAADNCRDAVMQCVNLDAVLNLIRPCVSQLNFTGYPCSLFPPYSTTCFGLLGQHQVHSVC